MKFHLRYFDQADPSKQETFITYGAPIEEQRKSNFNCSWLKKIFFMATDYTDWPAASVSQNYGSALTAEKFLIIDNGEGGSSYGIMLDGSVLPSYGATYMGDPNRAVRVLVNGVPSDGLDFISLGFWQTVGYTDPTLDFATWKTELCTQIKDAIDLYTDLQHSDEFNVVFDYNLTTGIIGPVFYYEGNDVNADEIVEIL